VKEKISQETRKHPEWMGPELSFASLEYRYAIDETIRQQDGWEAEVVAT